MGEPGGLPSMGSQSRTRLKQLSSSSSKLYCYDFHYHKGFKQGFQRTTASNMASVILLYCTLNRTIPSPKPIFLTLQKKILQPLWLPYGASPFLECQYPKN